MNVATIAEQVTAIYPVGYHVENSPRSRVADIRKNTH